MDGIKVEKDDVNLGDTYDSICRPARIAAEKLGNEKIMNIKDATSPKGIAVARFLEDTRDEDTLSKIS